jgi:FkbM family methyltransferase
MSIKRLLKEMLRGCGLEVSRIATSDDLPQGRLGRLIKTLQINTAIDVGANKGQYFSLLCKVGFQGEVFSFEPVPELYQEIRDRPSGKQQWRRFPYACGSQNGTGQINVAESSDFSSILRPSEFCLTENASARLIRSEAIEVRRLDSLMREICPNLSEKRFLLKIDTQGYDTEVFLGAEGILDSIALIQVEIPVIPLYENSPSMLDSLSVYLSAGFSISGLFPVFYTKDRLFVVEYDCLLVNRRTNHTGGDASSLRGGSSAPYGSPKVPTAST